MHITNILKINILRDPGAAAVASFVVLVCEDDGFIVFGEELLIYQEYAKT